MLKKRLLVLVLLLAVGIFFALGWQRFLSFDALKEQHQALQLQARLHPFASAGLFFAGYALITALSVPGATVLTLAAGAIFGLWLGDADCVVCRHCRRHAGIPVRALPATRRGATALRPPLARFNDGIARDGAFYLLTLRLVPMVPFLLINLLMGLTPIRRWTYYWVSQLGMLPGAAGVCVCRHAAGAASARRKTSCRPG